MAALAKLDPISFEDDTEVMATDTTFTGVPVRVYQPRVPTRADGLPAMLYVHGGGFAMGPLGAWDTFLGQIVRELGIVVVSVDYRLSPEHSRPAALEDCERAARHV